MTEIAGSGLYIPTTNYKTQITIMAILNFDYEALWQSLSRWAQKAGKAATRPALLMWYVMRDKNTPRKDKWAIFGSLAYLLLPIDILDAKRIPVIGWLDEVASLAIMVQKMSKHVTPEMIRKADAQLDRWFTPSSTCNQPGVIDTRYEIIDINS